MKKQKSFSPFDLRVDALEYLFVEWLTRNHLYRKFAKNLEASGLVTTTVRDLIRSRVRFYASLPLINFSWIIAGTFIFERTPEGREFWNDVSRRWADFCRSFFSILD